MVKEVGTDARSDLFFWSREPALFLLLINSCFVFSHYSLKENNIHCCTAAAAARSLQSCPTLCDPRNCSPPGSSNTGVCCHFLLQGLFPTQESNPCLLHWQADSLPLSHWEAPQPPEVWEISVCWLSLPVYGILLWWAELMKADR